MFRTLSILLHVWAIVSFIPLQAQNPEVVSGELLIMLKPDANPQSFMLEEDLHLKRVVSKSMGIYLYQYPYQKLDARKMLQKVRKSKSVLLAQENHKISLRENVEVFPDDPSFENQWSLYNTGQNSGTPGADIKAVNAWDIATGGLTLNGDSITVAIIDAGVDTDHEDLVDNLFYNYHEIPDNNTDDDGNGYIDDFYGWNAYSQSGVITTSNHGTHVSGIVGAKGNNTLGVSGVNWDVKLLTVQGSSTNEAIVAEALSYVYDMRKIYDTTAGQKGAYIVATNSSFGVDGGQPEDFPIWEALYDSLGQLGILNAGATANFSTDVDEEGDVPTAFTTDYMIAVTNTTNQDVISSFAAYGQKSIDLGAPGTLILNTKNNNTYGNSTGTSMATPHVAGAVALVFSSAPQEFLDFYGEQPAEGILTVKRFIMEGTDPLSTLEDKTVSGGRLNLFNTLQMMQSLTFIEVSHDSIKLSVDVETLGDTAWFSFSILNMGDFELSWAAKPNPYVDWMLMKPDTGTLLPSAAQQIEISFVTNELDTGTYETGIQLLGNYAGARTIPVQLIIDNQVNLSEVSAEIQHYVAPNPFTDYIEFILLHNGVYNLALFDLKGQKVIEQSFLAAHTGSRYRFETAKLPKGVYIYNLKSASGSSHGKLIKQ